MPLEGLKWLWVCGVPACAVSVGVCKFGFCCLLIEGPLMYPIASVLDCIVSQCWPQHCQKVTLPPPPPPPHTPLGPATPMSNAHVLVPNAALLTFMHILWGHMTAPC